MECVIRVRTRLGRPSALPLRLIPPLEAAHRLGLPLLTHVMGEAADPSRAGAVRVGSDVFTGEVVVHHVAVAPDARPATPPVIPAGEGGPLTSSAPRVGGAVSPLPVGVRAMPFIETSIVPTAAEVNGGDRDGAPHTVRRRR